MKDVFSTIAESKIREAISKGELKNLPGEGKPLDIKDMPFVPEGERAVNTIMMNMGLVPNEVALKREIELLERKLKDASDDKEKKMLKTNLQEKNIRYNILMEKRAKRF